MASREQTAPSLADIKRLFARSGNRCAFPKCPCTIAEDNTLIGEICHINAASAGGPRYDPMQTPVERHGYDNLVLMCANHHKVVDDDEEAYTVDRLRKMKAAHETRAMPLSDSPQISRVTQLLIDQSVATYNQSGGLTAHTVNAQTVNVHGPATDSTKSARTIQAVENIWNILIALRNEFGDVLFLDTMLTREELDSYFSGRDSHGMFETVRHYEDQRTIPMKLKRANIDDAQRERLFVSERLFGLFSTTQAVLGRSAILFEFSFKEERYRNWREDNGIDQLLRSVFSSAEVDKLKSQPTYGLMTVINELERAFLAEAAKAI